MLKDNDAIYIESVEKIRTGRTEQRHGWVLEAEGFACIIDQNLWQERSGYSTIEEYIANYEPVKGDPEYILEMVKVYKKLGKETIMKLTYTQARFLYWQPEEVIKAIEKDKARLDRMAKESAKKFKKSVEAINHAVGKKKDQKETASTVLNAKARSQQKEQVKIARQSVHRDSEGELWRIELNDLADSAMISLKQLIRVGENVQDISLVYDVPKEVVQSTRDFLDIMLNPLQHGEEAVANMSQMVDKLDRLTRREQGQFDVQEHFKMYDKQIARIEEVIARYKSLKAKTQKSTSKVVNLSDRRATA